MKVNDDVQHKTSSNVIRDKTEAGSYVLSTSKNRSCPGKSGAVCNRVLGNGRGDLGGQRNPSWTVDDNRCRELTGKSAEKVIVVMVQWIPAQECLTENCWWTMGLDAERFAGNMGYLGC